MSNSPAKVAPADADQQQARMDLLIGWVLLGGVALSVTLILAGVVWRRIATGTLGVDYTLPRMNLFEFIALEIRELVHGHVRPRLLVSLGIVALLLTPYVRVAASMVYFGCVERNAKYALFTGVVLAVLTYSLFLR